MNKDRSDHPNKKAVQNRLARAAGHLEKVRRMIDEERDCSEVLIQLSAVISALQNTGKLILKDHMDHCMIDALRTGDKESVRDFFKALDQFMK